MKLTIHVRPNSSYLKIEEVSPVEYKIHLTKPALEGKANTQLISVLQKHFKAPVKIIKGENSKIKLIEVEKCQ